MTVERQAIYLNAVPLIALGAAYLAAAGSLLPTYLRERGSAYRPDLALILLFGCGGAATMVWGLTILRDRNPIGGNVWLGLATIALASAPVVAFFARFRERSLLLTAPSQVRAAREAGRLRDAATLDDAADFVVRAATSLVDGELGALMLVEAAGTEARGVRMVGDGRVVEWFASVRLDLTSEPSGVASAYHDAAPFAVYDARASERVNAELVEKTGTQSVVYVPLIADQRVVAVLVVASTSRQRVFANDEIRALQSLAADAAPVVQRLRRAGGPGRALVEELAERVRSAEDPNAVLGDAVREIGRALNAERCFVRLGEPGTAMSIVAQWRDDALPDVDDTQMAQLVASNAAARERRTIAIGDVARSKELDELPVGGLLELGSRSVLAIPLIVFGRLLGTISVHRTAPGAWENEDVAFLESAARELAFGLQTAQLLAEGERRVERQTALLEAAQSLAAELEFERVLERLVDQVVEVVGADAADCWLFDEQRRVLRCRAVRGLPPSEVGREIELSGTIGDVVHGRRALLRRDFAQTEQPPPSPSYSGFAEVMDAPIIVDGEVRGVLGTCSVRANRFDDHDVDLLDTFASLAALALRNAEAFEERSRQARIQRGFYRIASVLGQPLSLSETLDALAHAAADAFGARFGAALGVTREGVTVLGSHEVPEPVLEAIAGAADETTDALRLAAEDRRVLASRAVASDERFSQRWRALPATSGFASLLVVPVEAPREDTAILVVVFFADERRLRPEDRELAHHLAQAARGALERSELFETERTSRALAQQLARTGGLLATELDPAAVLDEVVEHAPGLLSADASAVRVFDGDELVVVAATGAGVEDAVGARARADAWLAGDVARTRAPVVLVDARADATAASADPLLGSGYAAYLGVPLVGAEGSFHGVLSVYSVRARSWRREEVEALQALAANTSAALANAELYQRVALERERSAAILDNVADGIVAVDRDGDVVLWNRAAERVTGVPASEALGRDPEHLLGRDLSGTSLVPIVRGGGEIWLSVTEAVMRDPAGAVAGRIFAFRDISADRLVEEMKSGFVSTVSQELRGPLTSIYGFAETLLREDVLFGDDERRVFLGYISSEADRLTHIVDRLLAVARLDTGDLQVDVAPTDVRTLVADAVSAVDSAGSNGHDFVVDLPREPLAAEADADKLRLVLAHLLENAVKYSPDGGRVTVVARRKSDTVEFQIADEGIGIPESEQDRIFRKLYRLDDDRGGTGLGLYIARELVRAMGGRIWVESAEGEGSRFAFELPAARV